MVNTLFFLFLNQGENRKILSVDKGKGSSWSIQTYLSWTIQTYLDHQVKIFIEEYRHDMSPGLYVKILKIRLLLAEAKRQPKILWHFVSVRYDDKT